MSYMKKYIVRGDIPKDPALIIKNQLLLGPGQWNGKKFTREQIQRGMNLTKWNDISKRSIIYGHRVDGDASPDQWLGYHTIPTYKTNEDGVTDEGMYADLYFYDESLARKIAYGGAKAGVSERLEFRDGHEGIQIDGYLNLSVVDNPACKKAYLNLSDEGDRHTAEIMSKNYINLSDEEIEDVDEVVEEDTEIKEKSDLTTDERGSSNTQTVNMSDEKLNELESKIAELEKQVAESNANALDAATKKAEPEPIKEEPVKVQPVEEPKPEPVKEIVKEPEQKNQPVEITSPVVDNSAVVNAIKEMSDNFSKSMEASKIANPQSVAPSSPNNQFSSQDDEITEKLVKQYEVMHNLKNE